MKMRKLFILPVVVLALSIQAAALEVPTDTVEQTLNGNQEIVKVYTVSPDTDPQTLIEESFDLKSHHYIFANIVKEDNYVEDTIQHTETVSVETEKKDLSKILEQLSPTLEYDDGVYHGVLTLDHTTIKTEEAGYASGSRRVTEAKTIGPLDRNDMSSIPSTTVKDGKVLTLFNVEWQIIGTDLMGDALVPSSYQAVATYAADQAYSYVTGYISTAEYSGDITRNEVESITYRVTYLGTPISDKASADDSCGIVKALGDHWPYIAGGIALLAVAGIAAVLLRKRAAQKDAEIQPLEDEEEDEL